MALTLIWKIAANFFEANFFHIMCNECKETIRFYKLDNIEANTIVSASVANEQM